MLCTWCCAALRFNLSRHLFKKEPAEHIALRDTSNSTRPANFDIRLRHDLYHGRLVVINAAAPTKVLYKVICQNMVSCDILGWTRNRTNVAILTRVNTMEWYPHLPEEYILTDDVCRNETADIITSNVLLKQPLIISTKLSDDALNVTFFPAQKKYTIAYGTDPPVAEVENFDRSTPQSHSQEYYSLQIFERGQPKVDCAFLISICIAIDFIEWPHYLPTTYPTTTTAKWHLPSGWAWDFVYPTAQMNPEDQLDLR